MKKIYIGFSYNKNSFLSSLIRRVEDSKFSHVYIRRMSKYGGYVYQASGIQVNFMNIDIFLKNNIIIEEYEFELPDDKLEKIISFFIKFAGASYSLKSLFKILAKLACQKVGYDLNLKGDGTKTFICSELAAFFCEEILEIPTEDKDHLTPKMLNPVIKTHGKRIV